MNAFKKVSFVQKLHVTEALEEQLDQVTKLTSFFNSKFQTGPY